MLRIAPASDEDRDPPPTIWTPTADADGAIGTGDPEKGALAERIRNATFNLQSQGYSIEEIDRRLEALATALEDDRPVDPTNLTGPGVRKALRGYDVRAVDQFFEEVRASFNEM
jgi:hypothetical protein